MKRAAVYARVSTTKEEQDGSLERQLEALRLYAAARGFTLNEDHVFQDRLSGGGARTASREGYQRLRAVVRRRAVDTVIAMRIHRLSRSTRELCEFADELNGLGIALIIVESPIDTTTPAGRLMYEIFGAFGQFEREVHRERVLVGQARARARGVHLGRPALRLPMEEVWRLHVEESLPPSEIARRVDGTHAGPGGVIEVRRPSPALVRKRLAEVRRAGGYMRWKKNEDGTRSRVPLPAKGGDDLAERPATKTPAGQAKKRARRAKAITKTSKRRNR